MNEILLMIPILLLASSLISGFSSSSASNLYIGILSSFFVFIAFIFSSLVLFNIYTNDNLILYENFYNWISIDDLNIGIGYLVDEFSAIMLSIVLLISFLVHIYSIAYMKDESDFKRFFSYIALFTFSMILLVMSNNLIQLFIGWEGVGLVSYLLIGFFYKKKSAIKANLKAFLVNRIGDMFFILGIAMIYALLDSFDYKTIFLNIDSTNLDNLKTYFGFGYIDLACLFLFIGAMAKSAQIPLHVWLPDSMEGPTPISALIHAATMVTAGIFMVGRLSPLFELTDFTTDFILVVGASTAFFMGLIAIFENDIKRVIAYSTISQLGYMVAALGINAYTASFFHLYTHAFFKALLFLCAGSIIMSLHHNQDITKMGGLKSKLPITFYCFVIGTLCIIGFPLTSGFFSKDLILEIMLYNSSNISFVAYIMLLLGAFVTTIYSLRLLFIVFYGNYRGDSSDVILEQSNFILIPLIILAVLSIFSGYLIEVFINMSIYFYGIKNINYGGLLSFINHGVFSPASIALLAGFYLAKIIYIDKKKLLFLKNPVFKNIKKIIEAKYKFDELFIYLSNFTKKISIIFLEKIDISLLDRSIVNGLPKTINKVSQIFKNASSGYLYHYAFLIVFSIVLIFGIILARIL